MSNNKQQTAVEWLIEKLQESGIPLMTDEFEMIHQAKEMEKQQIINAVDGFPLNNRNLEGEQYYNETYGGKDGE
jgi:hypothetical protein